MANGDKVKPYVVFPGHKGEVQNLKKDAAIENRCYVESTVNGWMNENTTIDWVENVLKTFTFVKRRLFACGSFRAHLVQSVKELINKGKLDPAVIPGGATGHIQAADVSWSKPIKDQLREMYDELMDEGPHTYTKGRNMPGPPFKQIVQRILKVLSVLIKRLLSFHCSALLIQDDGAEDKEIACFEAGRPVSSGLEQLKAAVTKAAKEFVDPFTESEIENDPELVINSDREEDEDVDIE